MDEARSHNSEDRRVRRTKMQLRQCLFALLEKKRLRDITVKELTEAADVNRSTFYFYYRDINDMVKQIQDEIYVVFKVQVIEPEAGFDSPEELAEYVTRFLVFCKKNEKICRFVIGNDPDNELTERIKAALLEHIPDTRKVFGTDDPKCYLTCFAVTAIWETVIRWMYDGMKIPPETLASFLSSVYFYGGRTALLAENSRNP